ncbi:MAG: hypothetical protein V7767_01480 [Leeuwenhoekiella sp.]
MFKIKLILLGMVITIFTSACSSDDDSSASSALTVDIIGLQQLSNTSEYEAWLIVEGLPVSMGRFTDVNFPKVFKTSSQILNSATQFKLSIEPGNDSNSSISNTVILSGNFAGNSAALTIEQSIGNFKDASGEFVLKTPTDDTNGVDNGNDQSGVYWYDPMTATPGLNLPDLPLGWVYEGWVTLPTSQGDVNVSTGTFRSATGMDDFAPYSSQRNPAPSFPGEDFLNNSVAPAGITFPTDLRGKTVFISIEPAADTSSEPFFLRPLNGVAKDLSPSLNSMNFNSASFPLGSAAIN